MSRQREHVGVRPKRLRRDFRPFPYEYVHIGADEVEKNNWERCPDCRRRMRENGLEDTEQLQAWFVGEMEEFFDANGKKLIGWDEITDDELPAGPPWHGGDRPAMR